MGTAADTEAERQLQDHAAGKTGEVPAELLVRLVMARTEGAPWPVRFAALEALLRRLRFAWSDELRVSVRPVGGKVLGLYGTARPRSSRRPWRTLLGSADPPAGSCDCPDFRRNSLGLCKHLLVVLEDVWSKPRRLAAARREQAGRRAGGPRLVWEPVRPLHGAGDPLAQLRLDSGARAAGGGRASAVLQRFAGSNGDPWALRQLFGEEPPKRLALIEDLLPLCGAAEPAAAAFLREEHARVRRLVVGRRDRRRLRSSLRTMKRRLYPYQCEGLERFVERGSLLLADDMGLGKTAQAIAACHALWECGRVRRGLLIVPASLKSQWLREWRLFSDAPVAAVDGGPSERSGLFRATKGGFLLVNYEQVIRDLEFQMAWEPQIVVLDEAQRIKNWATKTAAAVKRFQPAYRLVLTGTPMENRLEELASLMDWVDDWAMEPKWRLNPFHLDPGTRAGGEGVLGNLDTLRERLRPSMLRRVRHEVLKQLPPRTDTVFPVAITEEQREAHDALAQPIQRLMQAAAKRPLRREEFLRLMQLLTTQRIIANGLAQLRFAEVWRDLSKVRDPKPSLLESLDSPKLLQLREILEQLVLEQDRKVVVFSQWRRMLVLAEWAVGHLLARGGRRAVFFTGQERRGLRDQNLVAFHDDPTVAVLFATDAGGVGLNLQHAANACVHLDLPWNPAVLEQRVGRIHRLGQADPIDVHLLVSQDCIEERIARILEHKRAIFQSLFDGESDEVRFEKGSSFLQRLTEVDAAAPGAPARSDAGGGSLDAELENADLGVGREVDLTLASADETADPPASPPAPAPALLPEPAAIRQLFARVAIRPREDGGLILEAEPDAAAGLAALFEGLAGMLKLPRGGED